MPLRGQIDRCDERCASAQCDACSGTARRRARSARDMRHLTAADKVRAQQGYSSSRRYMPSAMRGTGVADPCGSLPRRGRIEKTRTTNVKIPPGVDGERAWGVGGGRGRLERARRGAISIFFLHVRAARALEREGKPLLRARAGSASPPPSSAVKIAIPQRPGRRTPHDPHPPGTPDAAANCASAAPAHCQGLRAGARRLGSARGRNPTADPSASVNG